MKAISLKRILLVLLCLTSLIVLSVASFASGETPTEGSLGIRFVSEGTPIASDYFKIYRVASRTEKGKFEILGSFADLSVSIDGLDDTDVAKALAETLAGYVASEGIAFDYDGYTDANGFMSVSGMPTGLYLVIGATITIDDTVYFPQPFLVAIPSDDPDGAPLYDVVVEPKFEFHTIIPEPTERTVVKVWDDEGYENARPAEITVQLICDGEIYDEVTLTEEIGWKYTWTDLNANCMWQLVEKNVPEGYTVSVNLDGLTFTATNTFNPPPPETTVPETTAPDEPTSPPPVTTPDEPNLPQTGLLWWPIPVFVFAGVICIVVGLVLQKRRES